MDAIVTIDKAGRVVLPKMLRDELHLEAGDTLELRSAGDSLTLRPVRSTSPLHRKQGVWVFRGGKSISVKSVNKVLEDVRDARDKLNRGTRA